LAGRAVVIWETEKGKPQSTVVSIREALQTATGQSNEALVFELQPGGNVTVRVEQISTH